MNEPKDLQETIAAAILRIESNVATVRDFIALHPVPQVPATVFTVDLDSKMPCIRVHIFSSHGDNGREKLLGHIGTAWGADGWTRKDSYERNKFNWIKEMDGVALTITDAEELPPISTPVPPSAFPLLLADAVEA